MTVTKLFSKFSDLVNDLKSYFVQKSGDTMTRTLSINNPNVSRNTVVASNNWDTMLNLCDSSGNLVGYVKIPFSTNGSEGILLETSRDVNGSVIYNGLQLYIDPAGNRSVTVNEQAAWCRGIGAFPSSGGTVSGRTVVDADFEVKNLIDFHGGSIGSNDYDVRLSTPRDNDGELRQTAGNGRPMFTVYKGGSPEIYARMYADTEGGNIGWTAPDGSYNEIDSYNNTNTRIYSFYQGNIHSLWWRRDRDYNLDEMPISNSLTTRTVQVSVAAGKGHAVALNAPSVANYSFICWVGAAASGWVGACYIQFPDSANTQVWNADTSGGGGAVNCVALYAKTA